ncbi:MULTISPECIES: hypothetical protein [unclassified Streptomyces]|uniref:hypothetical protein n=1 Tax=unclassified Streptomyces TaxID=2593676 RepID=UPI000F64D2D7|nr:MULTISPECIES: hypothetical protein [unclassified Streptomyces]MBK3642547.1 hypothetical protein [Streptomyces sp. MBT33]RRR85238.1 hypothetical protein EHS43_09025 [Streptomyces sp. RP5T]
MSASLTPPAAEPEHIGRPASAFRPRRNRRMLAASAVLISLLAGSVATSAAVPAAAAECSQGGGTSNGACPVSSTPGITGSYASPQAVPRGIQAALTFWRQLSWPNWRNVAPRGAVFSVSDYVDQRGNRHREFIESGGQYQDHGNRLRNFMHVGLAGPGAQNYQGTFQEYYGGVYPSNPEQTHIATGNFRIVRAINTGDVWVSIDHYSNFRYVGRM